MAAAKAATPTERIIASHMLYLPRCRTAARRRL